MGQLAAQRWSRAGGVAVAADIDDEGLRATAEGHDAIIIRHLDISDAAAASCWSRTSKKSTASCRSTTAGS
jgi:hypothetical protein